MKIDTPAKRELIDKVIAENPKAGSRTLARLLCAKAPLYFSSVDGARSAIRGRRGVIGDHHRNHRTTRFPWVKKQAGDKSHLPPLPASKAEPDNPYRIKPGRVGILCDVHLPYHSEEALSVALEHLDDYRPDTILLGGDLADFFGISRFLTNPHERDLPGELAAVDQFLGHLRKRYPKAEIVWKLGNHEERWRHFIWSKAPELFGVPQVELSAVTNCAKHKVRIVDDRRKVALGKLTFLHGHELEQGAASPVNPARGVFLRTLDSCAIGHRHQASENPAKTMNGRLIVCWSVSCLCDLSPMYARVNKWNHGFATVEVRPGGTFSFTNLKIYEGRIL